MTSARLLANILSARDRFAAMTGAEATHVFVADAHGLPTRVYGLTVVELPEVPGEFAVGIIKTTKDLTE